jgi:hypothetical protein
MKMFDAKENERSKERLVKDGEKSRVFRSFPLAKRNLALQIVSNGSLL